jgi:hypothetical protein
MSQTLLTNIFKVKKSRRMKWVGPVTLPYKTEASRPKGKGHFEDLNIQNIKETLLNLNLSKYNATLWTGVIWSG